MTYFQPIRKPYVDRFGRPSVLVMDWWKGHKAMWVEGQGGKIRTPRVFFNPDTVRMILEGSEDRPTPA